MHDTHMDMGSDLSSTATLAQEIACVDLRPLVGSTATLCVVGLWVDMSIRILALPSLQELHQVYLL